MASSRYKKQLKRSSGLRKVGLLLKEQGSGLTNKTANSFAFSTLVQNFYIAIDDLMRNVGRDNDFDWLAEKIETDADFRRKHVAIVMAIIMGAACSTSQWGEKRKPEVFWADEIKESEINPAYFKDAKKAFNASYEWCENGMELFDPAGGRIVRFMLGETGGADDDYPDPTLIMPLKISFLEAIRMYRSVTSLYKTAGEK